MSEALERLLFEAYMEQASEDSPAKRLDLHSLQVLVQLISNGSREQLAETINDIDMINLMRDMAHL